MMMNSKGKLFGKPGDDIQLTNHFALSEFIRSKTAADNYIDNTPTVEAVAHLRELCFAVLEPVRTYMSEPVHISSGYRCRLLNAIVSQSSTSQHMEGKAADIYFKSGQLRKAYDFIREKLTYDQLILYPHKGIIHVSYNKHNNRRQAWIEN